jgi:hypothetical protein
LYLRFAFSLERRIIVEAGGLALAGRRLLLILRLELERHILRAVAALVDPGIKPVLNASDQRLTLVVRVFGLVS